MKKEIPIPEQGIGQRKRFIRISWVCILFLCILNCNVYSQNINFNKIIDSIFCKPGTIRIYGDYEILILNFLYDDFTDNITVYEPLAPCLKYKIFNDRETFLNYLKEKKLVHYLEISKHYDKESKKMVYNFTILKMDSLSYFSGLSFYLFDEFETRVYYIRSKDNKDWQFEKIEYPVSLTRKTLKEYNDEYMDSLKMHKKK